MRHRKRRGKLGMGSDRRKAMLREMTTSLLKHERISTTLARAKELRKYVERIIAIAKKDTLHARRMVMRDIKDKEVVYKLFTSLNSRYMDRPGGCTRIYKLGQRRGDAAPMGLIELVDRPVQEAAPEPEKKKGIGERIAKALKKK